MSGIRVSVLGKRTTIATSFIISDTDTVFCFTFSPPAPLLVLSFFARLTAQFSELALESLSQRRTCPERLLNGQHIVGALVVEQGLMSCFRKKFVSLTAQVEGLSLARLHLKDQLEAILCMCLLV